MVAERHVNWRVIGALGFCLLAWGAGLTTLGKTAHLYAHRSPAGFRHDVMEHARAHWVSIKRLLAPAGSEIRPS